MSAPMAQGRGAACACPEREAAGQDGKGPDTCAIIAAGGKGERFGNPDGKQFVEMCGLPLVCWSLIAMDRAPSVGHIVVVTAAEHAEALRDDVLHRVRLTTPVSIAYAGETRQKSVFNGLRAAPVNFPLVAVHDGARPLVEVRTIEKVIAAVREDETLAGAICATRAIDTLKFVEGDMVIATPDRSLYWAAQTPQAFRAKALLAAHKAAAWEGYEGTDDASLVERHGGRVRCVEGPRDNIKVTVPEDLAVCEASMRQRLIQEGCGIDALGRDVSDGGDAS